MIVKYWYEQNKVKLNFGTKIIQTGIFSEQPES